MKDDGKILCAVKHCVRCSDGRCVVLTDTDFGDRRCPFYEDKNKIEHIRQLEAAIKINEHEIIKYEKMIAHLKCEIKKLRDEIKNL